MFVTTDDIPSSMMDIVQSLAVEHGYKHVEFWGKTKLIGLLERHRVVLNEYFRAEVYFADEIRKRIDKYVEQLHQESVRQNNAIAKLELILKIVLALEAYQFISKLVSEFRPASQKLERDEKKLNEIQRKTTEYFEKHKGQLETIMREFTVNGEEAVKAEFIELAGIEQLGLPEVFHDVVKNESLSDDALVFLLVLSHARKDNKIYEVLWTFLMQLFYLYVADELVLQDKGFGSFLSGSREKCPSCKRRLEFDIFRGALGVSKAGRYLRAGFEFLYCTTCKFVFLKKLRVERDVRL